MAVPVILDCDPGHDDAFAIWLAAGHPNLDLRGITTVGGNGQLAQTTHNARVVCTVAGIHGVPIAAGADNPLTRTLRTAGDIHGESALDGPVLPEPDVELDPRGALGLLHDLLAASPEPVVVIATGPLTNIALLLRVHPQDAAKIKEIAWMGGSTGRGNVTPYAEFNCWVDPEAAAVVLDSGIRFSMVGLNVTHQALVTPEVMDRLSAIGNRTSAFAVELLTFFRSSYQAAQSMASPPLHDPVAVALVATPDLVPTVHTRVDIEVHGPETFGATSVDLHNKLGRPANAYVAVGLDVDRFWKSVEDAIRRMR
ncbi:MAG TPA: nucleoside hydrolase [Pseudonocardia sp.]|jgi:purine nucleosidase/pyrimidine-specific ribonucleoside hydrolase|nr:nucleoside hydrolase [Pseudonocardia sp.]